MVCIYCASDTQVTNSRLQKRSNTVWRRRRCKQCGSIITTEEAPKLESSLVVQHPNGTITPFLYEKLLISLYKSLAHRPTAAADSADLIKTVLANIHKNNRQKASIELEELVSVARDTLDRFDPAAGSHYQAYHPLEH